MADDKVAGAPALDTNIESGNFDEKRAQQAHEHHQHHEQPQHVPATGGPAPLAKKTAEADDDEDEDIDALIEDLESQDGHGMEEEEEDEGTPGGGRVVPEDMLQTDSRVGLTESEVVARRRKYGLNQMKEEKENLILKFFGYFIGPIQFVMEVSLCSAFPQSPAPSPCQWALGCGAPVGALQSDAHLLLPAVCIFRAFFSAPLQITSSTQARVGHQQLAHHTGWPRCGGAD